MWRKPKRTSAPPSRCGSSSLTYFLLIVTSSISASRKENTPVEILALLGERKIQIFDGFVNLGGVFVADGNAIDACVFEGESHGRLAVFPVEHTFAYKLHADDAHAGFAGLLDVGDHFGDVAQSVGVVIFGVHSDALVIHADHGDVEPFVSGDLAQRGKAVNGRAVTYDGFPRLSFENSVLPFAGIRGPSRGVLPVQQHDVEVFGVREFAQLVEFLLRIHAWPRGHLRHDAIAVAREALEGDAEHPVHVGVRLSRLEEAYAVVVRVAHQPRKPVLSQVALHLAAEAARAKCEARHLHS